MMFEACIAMSLCACITGMTGCACGTTVLMMELPAFITNDPALEMDPAFIMFAPAVRTRFNPDIAPVTPVGINVLMLAFAALMMLPLANRFAVRYWLLVEMM